MNSRLCMVLFHCFELSLVSLNSVYVVYVSGLQIINRFRDRIFLVYLGSLFKIVYAAASIDVHEVAL